MAIDRANNKIIDDRGFVYNGFSGVDIYLIDKDLGKIYIQGIKVNFLRAISPIYTMGGREIFYNKALEKIGGFCIRGIIASEFLEKTGKEYLKDCEIVMRAADEYGNLAEMKIRSAIINVQKQELYEIKAFGMSLTGWYMVNEVKKPEVIEEDHSGQIYNAYTKRWSWL